MDQFSRDFQACFRLFHSSKSSALDLTISEAIVDLLNRHHKTKKDIETPLRLPAAVLASEFEIS